MGPNLSTTSPQDIVAIALSRDDEDDAYWDSVRELQKRGTRSILRLATGLCSRPESRRRQLGLDILAQLGYRDGQPFLEEVLPIASKLATDPEPAVRTSALSALGYQHDPRGLLILLDRRSDPDPNVRWAVAQAIPSLVSSPPEAEAVAALVALTRDSDSDVRDWATFAIGSLLDVDGQEIREALTERLDDLGGDTAGEALVGLARRRDLKIVERVRLLLDDPNVGNLIVEAAGELADMHLVPSLERLWELGWPGGDPRGDLLESALLACRRGKPLDRRE